MPGEANFQEHIEAYNSAHIQAHKKKLEAFRVINSCGEQQMEKILRTLEQFKIAIPSWALGTGGTRFGRFPMGGEPRTLEEKIEDVSLLRKLTQSTDSISLHIPWDVPADVEAVRQLLAEHALRIDSVNSNTFQDHSVQDHSYKFGSLSHTNPHVRQQAIAHNIDVINHGIALGSKSLSLWLADGSNFPGQSNFRDTYARTQESLQNIYGKMPPDWTMLVEYKPNEPHFYSMVIPDWGTSYALCNACGERAQVLVDLGHHLPNTNIEQIVARTLHFKRLGGFHFNGSQYGDDDLTTGSIKPFQLFLIFHELVNKPADHPPIAYMIDASHNTKDPLEDLMQSLQNIHTAYAKAMLIPGERLKAAQIENDAVASEQILGEAFEVDVRPLLAEARLRSGGCLDPIGFFRAHRLREKMITQRGRRAVATGL